LLYIIQKKLNILNLFNRSAMVEDIGAGTHRTLQIATVGEFPVNFYISFGVKHGALIRCRGSTLI
jgi:hypothetical protein